MATFLCLYQSMMPFVFSWFHQIWEAVFGSHHNGIHRWFGTFFSVSECTVCNWSAGSDTARYDQVLDGCICSAENNSQDHQQKNIYAEVIFKYCLIREWIAASPAKTIQVLKTKKRLPTYVEAQQMDQLMRHDFSQMILKGAWNTSF